MKKLTKFLFLCFITQTYAFVMQDSLLIHQDSIINFQIKKDSIKKQSVWSILKYDARNATNGFLYTFTQPTRWQKDDYVVLGGTILGTSILYLNDKEISKFFRRQKNDIPNSVSEFGYRFGKPQINYGVNGSIYLAGVLTKNEKIRYSGLLMITSASVIGLLQQTLKTIAGRARPWTDLGHDYFKPFDGEPAVRNLYI